MSDTSAPDPIADVPPSEMEPSDLAAYVRREVRLDWEASGEWREEAKDAYDFVAGRQWAEEDIAKLNEEKRPAITFNRVAAMIDAVCGAQVNNRNEIKFLPRSGDDGGKAETLNGVARWVMDQTDAEDEDSEAFRDVAIAGMGWTETRMCYEEDQEGRILVERRDPFEMGWDRSARRRNLSDANQVWSRQKFSPEKVAAQWPEFATVAGVAGQAFPDAPHPIPVNPTRDRYAEGEGDPKDDGDDITVTHFQWCERKAVYRVLNPGTGEIDALAQDEWDALGQKMGEEKRDALRFSKQTEKQWRQVFECGGEVSKIEECPDRHGPTFKAITGKWDRNKRLFFGLVRAVKDPQMWANKWLSQSLHIINTNAKSGVLYETGAVENVRKFEQDYAKTGSAQEVAAGALSGNRIRDKIPPPFPQAFDRLMQFAISSMPDVTGINRELLGTVDREQAGVLEAQRKQASQAVLAPLFDSLRRYHKDQGRLLMVFMGKYIPAGKVIRITGPDGNPRDVQWEQLPEAAQYDIIVDQAPSSPNQKSEVWMAMQPMLPVLVKEVPAPVLLKLLRFSPLPESVVNEIQQEVQQLAQQPKPPDPAVMKVQADIEAKKAQSQMDMEMKQAEMQQAQQMAELEYQTEMRKAQMDLELQRIKAANEMEIARMKAQQDAEIRRQSAETDIAITERKATVENEKRAAQMKQDKDVLAEPVREIVGPLQEVQGQMAQFLADMSRQHQEGMQHLYALVGEVRTLVTAEKEVVRGPDGRVSGARLKQQVLN
jgi:hypothetical protein